jgi:hypothetical protein
MNNSTDKSLPVPTSPAATVGVEENVISHSKQELIGAPCISLYL